MRSTSERMELLQKRTVELQRSRALKKERVAIGSGYMACAVVVIMIAIAAAGMNFDDITSVPMMNTASIFAGGYYLGYAIVGIFAFVLGVAVTLLCIAIHKKNKGEDDDAGAGR